MGNEQEFLEGLQDLVRIGKTNGDMLTADEVRSYFSDVALNEAQMGLIAAYMSENQIRIDGVLPAVDVESEEEELSSAEEPSAVFQMYIDEMKEITSLYEEEEEKYLERMTQGDTEAVNQLVEMNLEEVVNIARLFQGKGIQMNDLIQEGNLALFCSVMEYEKETHGDFHPYMLERVRQAIEDAVQENTMVTSGARKMARLINQMNDLATSITKEFGREAKAEELAEKMHLSVEEVKDLMKVSLDAVNLFENERK